MSLTPQTVDIILFLILFIFAFLAFLKGFIRDFFSTANLILAILISHFLSPVISGLFSKGETPQMIIDLVVRFVLFVSILIIFSIFTSKISYTLSDKIPGAINQSLGLAFGLTKGYFIICTVFATIMLFYSYSGDKNGSKVDFKKDNIGPDWLAKSKSYDLLAFGGNLMYPLINNAILETKNNTADKNNSPIKELINTQKLYERLNDDFQDVTIDKKIEKKESEEKVDDKSGYTKQEIEKMERLIEIMSN